MMSEQTIVTIIATLVALFSGLFGQKLLDRWFERDKRLDESEDDERKRQFADNEQARRWLSEQLAGRDEELRVARERVLALLTQVGELAAQVARQEERSNAQAAQIEELKVSVAKWNVDYQDMRAERDMYRDAKHDADNKLTPAVLKAQLTERDLASARQEIERLHGQIAALSSKEPAP